MQVRQRRNALISRVHKPCVVCGSTDVLTERILNEIPLVRCLNCFHVYADIEAEKILALNINHYHDVYNSTFRVPDINMRSFKMCWFSIIANIVTKLYGIGSVLDIGCGNGGLLLSFRERGWQITGLDLSHEAGLFANKYGYCIITGLLEDVDIAPESFDCVTLTNVLEHIPEPWKFVKKLMDIVKPGGIVYLNVPNYRSLSIQLGISRFYRNLPPHHCSYFTPRSLEALFSHQGVIDKVSRVRVRTYGIPELHYVFSKIIENRSDRQIANDSPNITTTSAARSGMRFEKSSFQLKRIAVSCIYHAGRPFRCGDKIECLVMKKKRGEA